MIDAMLPHVPYKNSVERHQDKFVSVLTCTLVKVELTFGILNRKFACLKKASLVISHSNSPNY